MVSLLVLQVEYKGLRQQNAEQEARRPVNYEDGLYH